MTAIAPYDASRRGAADPQVQRILDAAYGEFTRDGVRATTMNGVAERAGLGVATVYRRFPRKALLVRAVVLREAEAVTNAVDAGMRSALSVEDQCAEGFLAFGRAITERPLLVRLLRGDAQRDGQSVDSGGLADQIIANARDYIARWIRDLQAEGRYRSVDADIVAEIEARVALSLVIVPEGRIPIEDADATRAFATRYLVALLGPE
jgi:AcrR family transcriptional regulator